MKKSIEQYYLTFHHLIQELQSFDTISIVQACEELMAEVRGRLQDGHHT